MEQIPKSLQEETLQDREHRIREGTCLITAEELAMRLNLSPTHGARTIREKVRTGRLPAIRINSRSVRFHWPSVMAKLQSIR